MIPWTDVRMHLVSSRTGKPLRAPSHLPTRSLARENLLRAWAEGDRRVVARVTDDDGRDLTPGDVDWSKMDDPPTRRAGQRVTTGRNVDGAKQVLVRLSAEEHERIAGAAGDESVAAWIRRAALRAAG